MKDYIFKIGNDKVINKLIYKELNRQKNQISFIASENYVSIDVMNAQGSCLTNKYAEGYFKNRYYEGCKYIDKIEKISINRAKKLFDADYANVQPHSGTQANLAIYNTFLKPGDKILSMELTHGGHLTHGSKSNISGKLYNFIHYKTNKSGNIDYNQIYDLAIKNKPRLIVAGSSSYSDIIKWNVIKNISKKINSIFLADISHVAGLIAAKIYPNPIYYADVVTTTTHKTLAGPRGGLILSKNKDFSFYKKIDSSVFPGIQGGPLMHVIAAKAISFKEAMSTKYINYQKRILKNIKYISKIFMYRNFKLVSKNVNSNLFLVDLTNKKINGQKASKILSKANIIVNKNVIPNEKLNYKTTSGIRIGSSCVSRRKIKKKYIKKISNWICDLIEKPNNKKYIEYIKKEIINISNIFPIY